jgi:hypothetical protein
MFFSDTLAFSMSRHWSTFCANGLPGPPEFTFANLPRVSRPLAPFGNGDDVMDESPFRATQRRPARQCRRESGRRASATPRRLPRGVDPRELMKSEFAEYCPMARRKMRRLVSKLWFLA